MIRLGELMVERGVLTPAQRDEALAAQEGGHARPLGVIVEEMFGVDPAQVESAWAQQYAMIAPRLDPRRIEPDPDLLGVVSSRQAWQFGLIPARESHDELLCVTAPAFLARALRFTGWRLDRPVSFAICDHAQLIGGLEMHYPVPGFSATMLDRALRDSPAA